MSTSYFPMLLQRSPKTLRAQSYDKIRPQTFQTIKKKKTQQKQNVKGSPQTCVLIPLLFI